MWTRCSRESRPYRRFPAEPGASARSTIRSFSTFLNDADTIQKAFEPYYRTTILSEETDPNKVHDLKATLDGYQVYSSAQVEHFVGHCQLGRAGVVWVGNGRLS